MSWPFLPISWYLNLIKELTFVSHLFIFFYVGLLCVFTFWVPCCNVPSDFRIFRMFGSTLVVCRRNHVFFTYVICVWLRSSVQHIFKFMRWRQWCHYSVTLKTVIWCSYHDNILIIDIITCKDQTENIQNHR
jgi:hypothetical protein